jgi:hypothetical protein
MQSEAVTYSWGLTESGTALKEFGFTAVSLIQIQHYFGLVLTTKMF